MSIPVDVDRLAETLADFGAAYLLTSREGQVKVVSVLPDLAEGVLRATAPGRGSVANVAANPAVTLLWPPDPSARAPHPGFSLLVDGTAVTDGDDVVVTPTGAVLHKPAR